MSGTNQKNWKIQLDQWFQFYQEKFLNPVVDSAIYVGSLFAMLIAVIFFYTDDKNPLHYLSMTLLFMCFCVTVFIYFRIKKVIANIDYAKQLAFNDLKYLQDNGHQVSIYDVTAWENKKYKKYSLLFEVDGKSVQIRSYLPKNKKSGIGFSWYLPKSGSKLSLPLSTENLSMLKQ
ncbi:hypothetical protein [Photobacterium leiognathi]|uniref:hypothetical protein n=1 Tax=Photobacterium leiognathi TaxID=553611 RepID=UPI00298162D6|nr:hypothetical protein [Photobacterium leiognathi]